LKTSDGNLGKSSQDANESVGSEADAAFDRRSFLTPLCQGQYKASDQPGETAG
jgi:hypothetical protein